MNHFAFIKEKHVLNEVRNVNELLCEA